MILMLPLWHDANLFNLQARSIAKVTHVRSSTALVWWSVIGAKRVKNATSFSTTSTLSSKMILKLSGRRGLFEYKDMASEGR